MIPGKVDLRMSIKGFTSNIQIILELHLDIKEYFLFSNKFFDEMKIGPDIMDSGFIIRGWKKENPSGRYQKNQL